MITQISSSQMGNIKQDQKQNINSFKGNDTSINISENNDKTQTNNKRAFSSKSTAFIGIISVFVIGAGIISLYFKKQSKNIFKQLQDNKNELINLIQEATSKAEEKNSNIESSIKKFGTNSVKTKAKKEEIVYKYFSKKVDKAIETLDKQELNTIDNYIRNWMPFDGMRPFEKFYELYEEKNISHIPKGAKDFFEETLVKFGLNSKEIKNNECEHVPKSFIQSFIHVIGQNPYPLSEPEYVTGLFKKLINGPLKDNLEIVTNKILDKDGSFVSFYSSEQGKPHIKAIIALFEEQGEKGIIEAKKLKEFFNIQK